MIVVKTAEQIGLMRKAGAIVKDVLDLMADKIAEGINTMQLDKIAYDYITKCGAVPSFLGYNGFPYSLCTSVDDEVVHGMPSKKVILEEGMLLKIDAGACLNGFHGDAARTFAIGNVSAEKQKLMTVCKESFFAGMKALRDGARLGDLGNAIQSYVEENGFSVVREMVGHGIGKNLHEDPSVPNYGLAGRGTKLSKNMTIAVEPMINIGKKEIYIDTNGWTAKTCDGSASAHYENTVVITGDGVEILTL